MSSLLRIVLTIGLALAAGPALAHSGHEPGASFSLGLAHPLLGWDHLLAMLAVGLWAGLAGGRALWVWPLAFVFGMTLGGAVGFAGVAFPAVEHVILVSVFALGLATLFAIRPPLWLGALFVIGLGVTHGNAHGLEAPLAGSLLDYAAGFLLATCLLHAAGLGVAVASRREGVVWLTRALGLGVALGGIALAAG